MIERWAARWVARVLRWYANRLEHRGDVEAAAMFRRQAAGALHRWSPEDR